MPRSSFRAAFACAALTAASARAEVPQPPEQGREFHVDFSAKHLEVDADLGQLSLSGDVVVTVGRYRLGGERVRLQRGPRGISVEGSGDIAFCRCEAPPVTLGYHSVTIAPPSDVIVERAVLRAGPVPLVWLPYLWLRSPDRVGVLFPSAEWRGDDGLLVGSGIHVPFSSNQGRPAPRALDIAAFGYLQGGVRVDAQLFTPQSTSFVRWDHLSGTALTVDARAAVSGESGTVWAYEVDASRGVRGRSALTSLEAAARRFDHARFGVGTSGAALLALGARADGARGDSLGAPASVGPFAQLATGGALGRSTSYSLDVAAGSWLRTGQREGGHESRGLERLTLESAHSAGPALFRFGAFEQGEWTALPGQAVGELRAGAGVGLSLPLLRRFARLAHLLEPRLSARVERRQTGEEQGSQLLLATAGLASALGSGPRGGAARAELTAGVAGELEAPEPVAAAELGADARWIGLRVRGVAEPADGGAEATARLRLGARSGTQLTGFVEARSEELLGPAHAQASTDVLPAFHERGAYDRSGVTTGAELTLELWSALWLTGGADVDALEQELLAVRSSARYRHACGCFAVAGFGSRRVGRGGFDAGLSVDLMP